MKRTLAILAAAAMLALTGCGTRDSYGWFYVRTESNGYTVAIDTGNYQTQVVTMAMPLPDAERVCNQLNHDLAGYEIRPLEQVQ